MPIISANHDPFFKEVNNPWNTGWEEEIQRIHQLLWKWKIFDLGFWVGRHIKQLLDLEYDLSWIDLSKIWYLRLQNDIKQKNQFASLYHWDMFDFSFEETYDCIFSNMSLQYADSKEQFNDMILKIKKHTNIWGINYIKLPAQGMSLWFPYKILDLETLKSYYSDWEIIFDSFETHQKKDGKKGVYVTIIAKNKKS